MWFTPFWSFFKFLIGFIEILCINDRVIEGIGIYKACIHEYLCSIYKVCINTLDDYSFKELFESLRVHSPKLAS